MGIKKIRKIAIFLVIFSIIGIIAVVLLNFFDYGFDVSNIDVNEQYELIEELDNTLFDIIPYKIYPLRNLTQDEVVECAIRYIMDNEKEYKQYIKEYDNMNFLDSKGKAYKIKTYISKTAIEEVINEFFYLKKFDYKKSKLYNKEIDAFIADYEKPHKPNFDGSEVIGITQISMNEYIVQIAYNVNTANINKDNYFLVDYKLIKNKDKKLVIEAFKVYQ